MSNHHHLVLTDVRGTISDFARELHRMTAKAMNAAQGQWENLWSAEPCHLLELGAEEDVVDKLAYLAANPVDAGLVAYPEECRVVLRMRTGRATRETVERPAAFFATEGKCPERVELVIVPPPI